MRTVIQRVKEASVRIEGACKAHIGQGLLVLAGFEDADGQEDLEWMVRKIVNLRVFDDPKGVMNLSLSEISGQLLVVSQFTLHASTRKGNRPSYVKAAAPQIAIPLYETFCKMLKQYSDTTVQTGVFGGKWKSV
jgi:D-tyrosyl-tRNA(Tyr) deacylase